MERVTITIAEAFKQNKKMIESRKKRDRRRNRIRKIREAIHEFLNG